MEGVSSSPRLIFPVRPEQLPYTHRQSLVQLKCTNTHLAQRCSWDVAAQVENIRSRKRYRLLDGVRPHSASCLAVSENSWFQAGQSHLLRDI